jgi:membrane protein
MKAINLAYDEKETRGFLKLRGTALLLTLGGTVFFAVAVGLVAVVPVVLDAVNAGAAGTVLVNVARFAALVVFMVGALAVLYRYGPDRDNPQFSGSGSAASSPPSCGSSARSASAST